MSAKQLEMERQTYMMMNRVNRNSMKQTVKAQSKGTATVVEQPAGLNVNGAVLFIGMAGLFCLTDLMLGLVNILL